MGGFAVAAVGPGEDLTYDYKHLGSGADVLKSIASGRHDFAKILKSAERSMLILGQGALARDDGAEILGLARKIADGRGMIDAKSGWNGFNVLHTAAARVGGLDLGFVPGKGGRDTMAILDGAGDGSIEAVYLLGADKIDTARFGDAFVIYHGHHGDRGAHRADVILPGAAYTEKNATYVNTEGRVQQAQRAAFPPGDAREDWAIIRALSDILGHTLPYDDLKTVRGRMVDCNSVFLNIDEIMPAAWGEFGGDGEPSSAPLRSPIDNFYMTDPISRASATMAACTEQLGGGANEKTGTDG
jgi:NADH-quinone oxidoreductase subunit G